ncbi:MAG: hypothetical protein II710_04220 [Clostridia bacterium]|nr:hypothetical protein [Clostridia bacterium]
MSLQSNKRLRIVSCFLCMLLVLTVFLPILPVRALDDESITVSPGRFVGSRLSYSSLFLEENGEDRIQFTILARRSEIIIDEIPSQLDPDCDLRISLNNRSGCQSLGVEYESSNGETYETTLAIEPNDSGIYYVSYPFRDVKKITLRPDGGTGGSLIFFAIQPVPHGTPDVDPCGDITLCRYDPSSKRVSVQGYVTIRMSGTHSSSRIGMFLLDFGSSYADFLKLDDPSPVLETEMTNSFSFVFQAPEVLQRLVSVLVCVIDPDGAIFPVTAPRCVELNKTESSKNAVSSGFKGAVIEDPETGIGLNLGHVVIDVDLTELFNVQTGDAFSFENHSFFFDTDYVQKLNQQITNYAIMGCRIYIRLLMSSKKKIDFKTLAKQSYVGTEEWDFGTPSEEEENRDGTKQNGQRAFLVHDLSKRIVIYAAVRFLCESFGDLNGFVIGNSLNEPFAGPDGEICSIEETVEALIPGILLISEAAREANSSIEIILPVTAEYTGSLISGRALDGTAVFDTGLFVEWLSLKLSERSPTGSVYRIMFRSLGDPWDSFEPESEDELFYPGPGNSCFDELFKTWKYEGLLGSDYLIQWRPSGTLTDETLSSSFAQAYLLACSSDLCAGFQTDLTGLSVKSLRMLLDYIREIDSSRRKDTLRSFVDSLAPGISLRLSRALSSMKGLSHTLTVCDPVAPSSVETVGSYTLWNFRSALSTRGWKAGPNCEQLRIGTSERGTRMLLASMHLPDEQSKAYIMVSALGESSIIAGDYLNISCELFGSEGDYTLTVLLGSDDYVIRTEKTIRPGMENDICFDVTPAASAATYMCLILEGNEAGQDVTLSVSRVEALSKTMDSDTLASYIERIDEAETEKQGIQPFVIVLIILFVLVEAIFFLMLFFRGNPNGKSKEHNY